MSPKTAAKKKSTVPKKGASAKTTAVGASSTKKGAKAANDKKSKKLSAKSGTKTNSKKLTKSEEKKLKELNALNEADSTTDEDLFGALEDQPKDEAEAYDEMIAQQMEREIVRSQRKKMAGKDDKRKNKKSAAVKVPITDQIIEIPDVISVKEFAEKTGIGAAKVIGELMKNGILANINQQIDYETAQIIAVDCGVNIKRIISEATAEDVYRGDLEALLKEDDVDTLVERPPIVVVMGHVDHGKTSLLDHIREEDVVKGESGGITQHIGAYQVEKNDRKITFLDTPGHEAFTAMRARGAKVTDIAILVVAADEGVKPQTIEAIQHGKEAGVPIIVAINKIDKDGADPDRVMGELGEYDLIPEEWGGSTIMVPVSAHTGEGIKQLLDMILLVADLNSLKANPDRAAVGTVIEAHLDKNLGPVATVIVNSGTLKVMDSIVVGGTSGRIKLMKDHKGKNVLKAGPSVPVLIAGLEKAPQSGDIFQALTDEKKARLQAHGVQSLVDAERFKRRGVGEIITQIGAGKLKQLKLVLKADAKGSLEAIRESLSNIKNDDVGVKVILSGVGNVTESDVMMAAAAQGIVMGFHTGVHRNVARFAERENVEILQYEIIYKLLDDVKKILTGLLEPEEIEVVLGKALVKQIFLTKKKEMIVGCKVTDGHVEKVKVRVIRDDEVVGEGQIISLKKVNDNVKEVQEGNECGIQYSGFMPLLEGDILEAYRMEKRVRTL